jgi:prepilin-type N-terminal cleavage/methylation domain-containing protein
MIKKFNRGFTLIELLVVIAIIGILSSVVLASLNTARSKGSDAAVKSNLNNLRAQAELVYDNASPNSYTGVCADPGIVRGMTAAASAGGNTWASTAANVAGMACVSSAGTSWIAFVPLKSANVVGAATGVDYWCVDSSGQSKAEDAAPALATATCI